MPIPFSLLPEHLRIQIVQKQDIRDFLEFHVSSQEGYQIAKKIKTRFEIEMESLSRWQGDQPRCEYCCYNENDNGVCLLLGNWMETPVRFVCKELQIEGHVSEDFCKRMTEFLLITNSTFAEISFIYFEGFECTPDQFNNLLEASKACRFNIMTDVDIPLEFLRVPGLKGIEQFGGMYTQFNDVCLLSVKVPSINVWATAVTNAGINAFLKQWLNGEREISEISISIGVLHYPKREEIFDGIPFSVVKVLPDGNCFDSAACAKKVFIIKRGEGQGEIAVRYMAGHVIVEVNRVESESSE